MNLKELLKKILPMPYVRMEKKLDKISKQNIKALNEQKLNGDKVTEIEDELKVIKNEYNVQIQKLNENIQMIDKKRSLEIQMLNEINERKVFEIQKLSEVLNETNEKRIIEIQRLNEANERSENELQSIKGKIDEIDYATPNNLLQEILWANIFQSTISESIWLKNKSFSLGGWAIGYPCAYVLYRVLDETHPKNILELGLGQSTKITGQYSNFYNGIKHKVIEHDPEWIEFFSNNFKLSEQTEVVHCEWDYIEYKEIKKVRIFKGFERAINNTKYDLIMIDAPWGGDMKDFSRIDVLRAIPECLADSFVIIFDDCDRVGEFNTFTEMKAKLDENNISYKVGQYKGKKEIKVICSPDKVFLLTM